MSAFEEEAVAQLEGDAAVGTIRNLWENWFPDRDDRSGYQWEADIEGLNFYVDTAVHAAIESGNVWQDDQGIFLNGLLLK